MKYYEFIMQEQLLMISAVISVLKAIGCLEFLFKYLMSFKTFSGTFFKVNIGQFVVKKRYSILLISSYTK